MQIEEGAQLAGLTTIGVGGPAERLVTAATPDEIVDAVREVDDASEPLLVLSGGSNLLIGDGGFPGTVLRIASRGITVESNDLCSGAMVRVAAGEDWDAFVEYAVQQGWAGIEAMSGIPGLVGASPVQNIGAYGQEVAQTIARVRVWDRREEAVRTFTNADCRFAYRGSLFKASAESGSPRYVVLDVTFQLEIADLGRPVAYADLARGLGVEQGDRVPLADVRSAVLEQRRRRGMLLDANDRDTYSCGSFFTNPILSRIAFDALRSRVLERVGADASPPEFPGPDGAVKTSAAWLIDRAGFAKGYGLPGPASLSTKHTLALTNRGNASAADVLALAREIRDGVDAAFGVRLVNEPVFVGLSL